MNPPPPALSRPFKPNQQDFARPALSPFGSKESLSPAVVTRSSHSPSKSDESTSRIHLKDLFAASPEPGRPSLDSKGESDLSHGHGRANRRSFAGQPIVDDHLLHGMAGTGRGTYAGLGGIDEFGQTVRSVSGEVRLCLSEVERGAKGVGENRNSVQVVKGPRFGNCFIPFWSFPNILHFHPIDEVG
jgi:hypothetical protein